MDREVCQDHKVNRVCKETGELLGSLDHRVLQAQMVSQVLMGSLDQKAHLGEMVLKERVDPRGIRDHRDLLGCLDYRD